MDKHYRPALVLLLAAMILANTVTLVPAESGGPGMTEPAPSKAASEEPQRGPGVIIESSAQEADKASASNSQQESGTSGEFSGSQEAQLAAQLAAEQAAADEAAASRNLLAVVEREPRLQTTVLLNDAQTWSSPFVDDQQITGDGQSFCSISTYLENIHGNVLYRTYDSTRGWTPWSMNGQETAHNLQWIPVEAIQYRFAGPVSDKYDIYYTSFLSDGSQTGWGKNGETVGTMNEGLYMTGFRLAFFEKGTEVNLDTDNTLKSAHADGIQMVDGAMRYIHGNGDAYTGWGWLNNDRYYFSDSVPVTGWQYVDGLKYYFGEDGRMWSDVEPLIGTAGPFMIKINKQMNCLTVYAKDGDNGFIIPVKSFLTSVGEDTPIGTFRTPEKYRWRLMIHDVYTQYATRLGKGLPILMHSIIYDAPNPMSVWASTYNNLGIARSAGCIRLASGDSKWIYDHCAIGTTVEVYNSPIPGPFERPTIKYEIPFEQTWDPTDPNVTQAMIDAETQRITAKLNSQ